MPSKYNKGVKDMGEDLFLLEAAKKDWREHHTLLM